MATAFTGDLVMSLDEMLKAANAQSRRWDAEHAYLKSWVDQIRTNKDTSREQKKTTCRDLVRHLTVT